MKNKKLLISSLFFCTVLALVNAIFFIVPKNLENNGISYWLVYAFTNLLVIFGLCASICLLKQKPAKQKVYFIPVLKSIYIFNCIQLVLFVIALILFKFVNMPYWPTLLVEIIVLSLSLIYSLLYLLNKTHITSVDNLDNNQEFISKLRLQTSSLVRKYGNTELKTELNRLNEAVKYTTPVSKKISQEIEDEILEEMIKLNNLFNEGDYLNASKTITNIKNLILDRKELLSE